MADIGELKQVLEDITFEASRLQKAVVEIKEIEDLAKISEHLKKLENFKIDTSRLEVEFEREILKVGNQLKKLGSKVDFSELDEISEKLRQINKQVKPQRWVSLFLVLLLGLMAGYSLNIYRPIVPVSKTDRLMGMFESEGVKIGENQEVFFMTVPENSKIEVRNVKGGKAVILKK
ncbi:MAG: hypothetical protein M0R77_19475 [Gammaproteobacteria bacterium]|nr:hypothetical protein [Gammaproteobacteria bacterium]